MASCYGNPWSILSSVHIGSMQPTCGLGEQVHGLHALPVVVPSLLVKSKTLFKTMTRAVLSLNQVVSSANDDGVAGVADPPPVVPAAWPNGVPTAVTASGAKTTAKTANALNIWGAETVRERRVGSRRVQEKDAFDAFSLYACESATVVLRKIWENVIKRTKWQMLRNSVSVYSITTLLRSYARYFNSTISTLHAY